jgi:cell division protein FtsB
MHDDNLRFVRALRALFESRNTIRRRLFWYVAFAAALFVFLFAIGGNYGLLNVVKLRRERTALESRNRALEEERDRLRQEIVRLKYDKREIERVARQNYGMAKPGEKVIKFVEPRDTLRRP